MDLSTVFRRTLVLLPLVLLSACSGQTSTASATLPQISSSKVNSDFTFTGFSRPDVSFQQPRLGGSRPSWMHVRNDLVGNGLYVDGYTQSAVLEYKAKDKKNQGPICQAPAPYDTYSITTDSNGNVWAATPQGSQVVEIAAGCGSTLQTLSDPDGYAVAVALTSKGKVYVANEVGLNGKAGNIEVYKPGTTSPSQTLTSSIIKKCYECGLENIAVDKKGNVYVTLAGFGFSEVVEFLHGGRKSVLLGLTGITAPQGIYFDRQQNMILVDGIGGQVEIFAPPYSGSPTSVFALKANSPQAALNNKNTLIYLADYLNGTIDVYSYPSGAYKYSITAGIGPSDYINSVAISPRSPN